MMGLPLVVKGFIAAVLGGLGNPYAALAGGVILGLSSASIAAFISTGASELFTFLLLIIVLLVRPRGMFGEPEKFI